MNRWLIRIVSVVSTLCFVVTVVFWVRSISSLDELNFVAKSGSEYSLSTHPHGIDLSIQTNAIAWSYWLPPVLRPKLGWSTSSHRLGSTESFDVPSLNGGFFSTEHDTSVNVRYEWAPPAHYWHGFGWRSEILAGIPAYSPCNSQYSGLELPMWCVAVIFAAIPLWSLFVRLFQRLRVARRTAAGFCRACGYDLRGTPARCPECGSDSAAGVSSLLS